MIIQKQQLNEKEIKHQGLICNECWKWYKRWNTQPFDFTMAIQESDVILEEFKNDPLCADMMYLFTKHLSANLGQTEEIPEEWRKRQK